MLPMKPDSGRLSAPTRRRAGIRKVTDNLMNNDQIHEFRDYQERLHIALRAAKICVFEVDLERQLYTFFDNAEDIFGVSGADILRDVQPFSSLPPEEYQAAASAYFAHPDDREAIEEAFRCILNGVPATYEARMQAGHSAYVWCKVDVTPIMEDGEPVKMVGVITDISHFRRKTDLLMHQVHLDLFTGMYNKEYARGAIKDVLSKEADHQHALLLLDIDDFKTINDTLGHAAGDIIIKDAASRITRGFRTSDIVSRFGGDEFLILARDIPDCAWLQERLAGLLTCEHSLRSYTNSIGATLFPRDGGDFDHLFEQADRALYLAKNRKATCTFAGSLDAEE